MLQRRVLRFSRAAALLLALGLLGSAGPVAASGPADRVLIVGSEVDYPPFALGEPGRQPSGFTVELWQAVAAEVGLRYRFEVMPFHELLQQFKDGRIDVLINLAQPEERKAFADFSVPRRRRRPRGKGWRCRTRSPRWFLATCWAIRRACSRCSATWSRTRSSSRARDPCASR